MLIALLLILTAATLEGVLLGRVKGHYDWHAYLASAGDLGLRIVMGVLPLGVAGGALAHLWDFRVYTMPLATPWTWALLLVGQDFCYYWMHRADHRVRWLWATHAVHHSPNELNLSAAYRLGFTARLSIAPLFFAPLVLIGFPVSIVAGALALNLLYQFWLHAPWIPTLGPLEWVLNTPAHHRIHHASNPEYIDTNFGGVFIVFDRLFGSFRSEIARVPIRYGLVEPIESYNPLRVGLHEWSVRHVVGLHHPSIPPAPPAFPQPSFKPPGALYESPRPLACPNRLDHVDRACLWRRGTAQRGRPNEKLSTSRPPRWHA
jgi:sterol desaturase/sphingolipid hydroxylase (fatty acid hydroxylase superfamily)